MRPGAGYLADEGFCTGDVAPHQSLAQGCQAPRVHVPHIGAGCRAQEHSHQVQRSSPASTPDQGPLGSTEGLIQGRVLAAGGAALVEGHHSSLQRSSPASLCCKSGQGFPHLATSAGACVTQPPDALPLPQARITPKCSILAVCMAGAGSSCCSAAAHLAARCRGESSLLS